ncbi:hypothetical protein OSSY52_14390 [Tepiditoga spiralis]|uniref:Flagellar protein FliO/FliZ n=1 Tax=Tepiditoga spiralis TaxID=2108365 RepID=A0A7G1G482_9BACT|nr:hypothetical protein [Tepiditoga spiralis]BBE31298.1 hypothetical protein OSSY52_14390 [Tepiditoga spiralis]
MFEYATNTSTSTTNIGGGSLLFSGVFSVIFLTFILIIFIILYFFLIKHMRGGKKNNSIGILKKYYIDNNFYIGILKIFNEYYMVLFGNSSSEIIKKMSFEEVNEIIGDGQKFFNTFTNFLSKEKDKGE